MATSLYLRLTTSSGPVPGDVIETGREGLIAVTGFTLGVSSQTAAATGPGGLSKVTISPLTVTKVLDRSTLRLCALAVTGEGLPEVSLHLWRTGSPGPQEEYFTIKLTDALVASTDLSASVEGAEVVTFAYSRIEWTWMQPQRGIRDIFAFDVSTNTVAS